jgi:transposase
MKSYIGIDWSEKHHNVCILNEAGASLNRFQVPHTLAGFQRIGQQLAQVNEVAADCLVAIETDHNTLVDFLWSRGITLFILPPKQVKSNRGRHRSSLLAAPSSAIHLSPRLVTLSYELYSTGRPYPLPSTYRLCALYVRDF